MTPIKKTSKTAAHKPAAHHATKHAASHSSAHHAVTHSDNVHSAPHAMPIEETPVISHPAPPAYETLTPTVKPLAPLAPLSTAATTPLPTPTPEVKPVPVAPLSMAAPKPATPAPAPINDEKVLDTRQEFFKLMSEKIKEEKVNAAETAPEINQDIKVKSVNLYRKIAIRFIVLALILVAVVGYFALTKLTIVISPQKETIKDTLSFSVYGSGNPESSAKAVRGNIARLEEEVSGTFNATGEKTGAEQFVGSVKITNTITKAQPLVATTRLLSADGKLFHIKNTVTVPAKGSVNVDVYPDKPGSEMAIGPSHFTIPGLNPSLQDKIFADSAAAFSNSVNSQKVIQQSDVDAAKTQLSEQLISKVKQSLTGVNSQFDLVLYIPDEAAAQVTLTNAKVGDVKTQFEVKLKNVVNVISFTSADVKKLAQQKMAAGLTSEKILTDISQDSLNSQSNYSFVSYDATGNIATVSVAFEGQAAPNKTDFIDKGKLVNLTKPQLESYLRGISEIKSFDLNFFPSFIKRAPSLVDRIKVVIQ